MQLSVKLVMRIQGMELSSTDFQQHNLSVVCLDWKQAEANQDRINVHTLACEWVLNDLRLKKGKGYLYPTQNEKGL